MCRNVVMDGLRLRPNAEIDPELLRIVLGIASSTGVRNDVTTDG